TAASAERFRDFFSPKGIVMFSPSSKIPGWDGALVLLYQTRLRGECSGGSKAGIGFRALLRMTKSTEGPRACRSVGLQERIDVHVIFFEAGAHAVEGFVNGVSKLEQFVFLFVDGAPADHGFPIQHFIPILFAVNQDQIAFGQLSGLQ